jgi:SAM-dependent methyltransferase
MTLAAPIRTFDPAPVQARYRAGEYRAVVFRDMVRADLSEFPNARLLDIGCGRGFDDDLKLQASLAAAAGSAFGVEPDEAMPAAPYFEQVHRTHLEDAQIPPESIDVAYAVMVLEHLERPQLFWDKVYSVLRPGGVFWGFTMDARHWFVSASLFAARLGVKDLYLNLLHGQRGDGRYSNYPTYYRSNTPDQIERLTPDFQERNTINFNKVGELDYYMPGSMQWVGRSVDRIAALRRQPGSVLAVRVVK